MNKCTNPHCHSITADIYVDGSWIRVCPVCGRKEALPSNHRMPMEADKCAGMGYVQAQVMNYAQAEALFREAYEMSADDDLRAGYIWWAHLCCYGIVYVEEIQNKGDSQHESIHYIPQIARFPLNEAALTGCETLTLFNEYMSDHPHAGMRQLANEIEKLYATAHEDMQHVENHCDVFIAWHDRPDQSRCQEFARELQNELMLTNKRCFFSPINMKKFRVKPLFWEGRIYAALATAKAFVIVVDDYDALGQGFLGCEIRRMALRNSIESAPIIFSGLSGHTGAVPDFMQDWQLHFENSENTSDRIALVSRAIIDAMPSEPAQSDDGERTIDNFRCFFLNDDEAEITGYLGSATRVIIPGALAGHRVTAIGDFAFKDSGIINISLPEGLERIGCFAFEGCARLTRLSIPQSVTSIDADPFRDCARLSRVTVSRRLALRFFDVFVGHEASLEYSDSDEVASDDAGTVDAKTVVSDGVPDTDTDDFDWNVVDGENGPCVAITGYHGSAKSVKIPSVIRGRRVGRIDDKAFQNCSNLKKVIIPDSVTIIGEGAFDACSSLTDITIPASVISIGSAAFGDCTSLTSITIPDSVTRIGNSAFWGCISLTGIVIPASVTSIGIGVFHECTSLVSITIPASVTSLVNQAFEGCTSLTSITIPDSVTCISDWAFSGCTSLTGIKIPASVTSIGNWAFGRCTSLTSVTIPNSVTSIGYGAFEGCTNLTNIAIPDSVTSIGHCVFDRCYNLTRIAASRRLAQQFRFFFDGQESSFEYYDSEKDAADDAEIVDAESDTDADDMDWEVIDDKNGAYITITGYHGSADTVRIPSVIQGKRVRCIGDKAFYERSDLTEIMIPNSVTSIGSWAFGYCSSLDYISISDSVTCIGDSAFSGCSSLVSITIPDSVTSIGNSVFYGCSDLTDIMIPDSVTSIGKRAFYDCVGLIDVTIPDSVTCIGDSAFSGCSSLTSVTIPASVASIGSCAFYECSGLTNITIPASVTSIGEVAFMGCTSLTGITIPTSVTCICNGTFEGCTSLTNIRLPGSVASIGCKAFSGCGSLTGITIPDSVTKIESRTFEGCAHLTSITIPASVTCIGDDAFRGCSSLTSITIPDSVTSIGDNAFRGCSGLTSITIPDSVTSIGEKAFYECISLTDITASRRLIWKYFWAFRGLKAHIQ